VRAASWHVYVIRCGDGSLYTGIATDVRRRLAEHVAGGRRSARFLRGRGPLELVLQRSVGGRGTALRLERRIKRLSRAHKESLVDRPEEIDALIGSLEDVAGGEGR
jgi:putative endonuclease